MFCYKSKLSADTREKSPSKGYNNDYNNMGVFSKSIWSTLNERNRESLRLNSAVKGCFVNNGMYFAGVKMSQSAHLRKLLLS